MTKQTSPLEGLTNAVLLLQIVAAERECSNCKGVGGLSSLDLVGIPGADGMYQCAICNNTGKVPILDPKLMRLPCDTEGLCKGGVLQADDLPWGRLGDTHRRCRGRGWAPNLDAWTMKRALHQAKFHLSEGCVFWHKRTDFYWATCWSIEEYTGEFEGRVYDTDPERARLLAEAKAFGLAGH